MPGEDGTLEPLRGDYTAQVRVALADPADTLDWVRLVVGGSVYGLLGTDGSGRDLAEGLAFGLPVALLIGIAAATVSTAIGTGLGLLSGYKGGRVDLVIQRAADVVNNVPLLPLLIFFVFVLGAQLWLILLLLVAFSWPGLTILVRSMVLGLSGSQEVEAARALGASTGHILRQHIFPHTAPYVFTQLIFFVPAVILAEAGLSFLGLGDPTLPTWGQILEDGFRTGAVFLGYWWWVVSPGLLIVLTAMTFMLLALAMEPVVNPRLRPASQDETTRSRAPARRADSRCLRGAATCALECTPPASAGRCAPSTASPSTSPRARRWASSASRAAARPAWPSR